MAVVLDTNVILSAVTDRDLAQRARAESIFRDAATGHVSLRLPQFVLLEAQYVMRNLYGRPQEEIAAILADLVAFPGIAIEHEVPLRRLFDLWPKIISEMPDACLAAIALGRGDDVATFDVRLAKKLRSLGVKVLLA